MTCSSCGATAPADARFCPACGQPLVVRPDERRVVTVVFADLVGFTTFSESADPEHVKNLVDGCFDRLAADVTSFGGRVDKIVGDALVALFGAPIAHEDDPERAVRAALALQETMARYCTEHEVDVQLRVGVNTGEVLVGAIRAGDDYTAMGDVVNTASRLEEAATPGQVLVGRETHLATRDVISYEEAGSLRIRGREQPIDTWIALEARTPPGRHSERGDSPLVGRERELALLRHAVQSAEQRRHAAAVLLVGEAGVGKSRLVREATAQMPGKVLVGHCVPYGESNTLAPIGDALRHLLDLQRPSDCESEIMGRLAAVLGLEPDDAETVRVASGLAWLMGLSDAADVDPGRARDEALRSVQIFFEALSRDRTLVLVLSDLQWADDELFDVLDFLLTRLHDRPFVVLVTARPELAERWSPSVRFETSVIQLGPLDTTDTAALVRTHLGTEAPDSVVELLIERSGGNPFFVEELVAIAAETDEAVDGADTSAAQIRALPSTLRGLVAARLDALDPDVRGVLEDCAVAGSTGPVAVISALAATRGTHDVEVPFHALTERGLLAVSDGSFTFRSELVREIAYNTLTKAARATRHGAIAELSETLAQGPDTEGEHVERLALHYGAAATLVSEVGAIASVNPEVVDRAVGAHERAAAHAEALERWHRAEEHLEAAIALTDDTDPRSLDLLVRMLRARIQRHHLEGVDTAVATAEELASRSDDEHDVVATLLLRGLFEQRSERHAAAIVAYDRAVELAARLEDDHSVAEGLRGRGLALLFAGEHADAESAFQDALDIYTAIGNHRGEAWALQNLAWIGFLTGRPSEADERLQRAVEMFTQLGDWGGLDWALGLHAWVRFNQGRLAEAEELATRVYGDGIGGGDAWALGMMGVLMAQIALWSGRPQEAIDRCEGMRHHFEALGDGYGTVQSLIPVPRALAMLGRLHEAEETLHAIVVAARAQSEGMRALARVVHMAIGAHLGDGAWCEAVDVEHSPQINATNVELRLNGAMLDLQGGDVEGALDVLEREHAHAASESGLLSSAGFLAIARCAAGRADEALTLTAGFVDVSLGSYLDRLQIGIARALAGASAGDAELATTAAARAVELADATESPLDRAIARLARAVVLETLAAPEASDARADAEAHLDTLGVSAPGWRRAFDLAVTGATAMR